MISLTDSGRALAARLRPHLPSDAEYLHQPQPFRAAVRTRFQAGHRLVLICATGIAVRTLAPVLADKHSDPAVLVLDEHGRFVIPLLSGHEGGANDWARELSEAIAAHCVITSARRYTHPLLVAGMGCERGCSREALEALMEESLASRGLSPTDLHAIASIDLKRDEGGLLALAQQLALPIAFYPAATLLGYTAQLSGQSDIVFRETGCYGVAEAAALAHDFCAISLSDLLTPWERIETRLHAAGQGDFVVALYNPVSRRRTWQLARARDILLRYRDAGTPVVVARSVTRPDEAITVTDLGALNPGRVDMLTLVLVGNSETRRTGGWVYTPRGYRHPVR